MGCSVVLLLSASNIRAQHLLRLCAPALPAANGRLVEHAVAPARHCNLITFLRPGLCHACLDKCWAAFHSCVAAQSVNLHAWSCSASRFSDGGAAMVLVINPSAFLPVPGRTPRQIQSQIQKTVTLGIPIKTRGTVDPTWIIMVRTVIPGSRPVAMPTHVAKVTWARTAMYAHGCEVQLCLGVRCSVQQKDWATAAHAQCVHAYGCAQARRVDCTEVRRSLTGQ